MKTPEQYAYELDGLEAENTRLRAELEDAAAAYRVLAEFAAKTERERDALHAELSVVIDQIDLNRDEFLRIKTCPAADDEIRGLCERSQNVIMQRVPVLTQRDEAEKECRKLRSELAAETAKVATWQAVAGDMRTLVGQVRADLAAAREALESYAYCGDNCGPAQRGLAAITRPPDVTEEKP